MKLFLSWTLRFFRFLDTFLEKVVFDVLLAPARRAWTLGGLGLLLTGWLVIGQAPELSSPTAEEAFLELGTEVEGSALEGFEGVTPDDTEELSDAKRWLYKRPWLDHLPKDSHDPVLVLVFDQRSVGVVAQVTRFRGSWEMFKYRANENEIFLVFPHDQRKFKTRYSIEEIKGEQFDLKLTLHDAGRGPKVFYSSKKHRHGMELDDSLNQVSQLEGALEHFALQQNAVEAVD